MEDSEVLRFDLPQERHNPEEKVKRRAEARLRFLTGF